MLENNTSQIVHNNQVVLLEKAKVYRHQLKSCQAAFRLLEGAVLTGIVEAVAANKIVPDIVKYEQNLVNKNGFAKEFFELAGKPLFKEEVNNKYKKLKEKFPRIADKKILVIDDQYAETGWKQVFHLLFGSETITGQNNSKAALKYLENHANHVMCILLDLRLPSMEEQGIELLKVINRFYPQIPVIIFSISDSIIYARQVFKLGAWDFFPKEPLDSEHRNPIDYFLTFYDIITNIWAYNKNYVEPFWEKIIDLERDLEKYDNQQGSGLAQSTIRELKKAYRHFVFDEMNNFTASFLEMNQFDEVIFCCSKSFESYLKLFTKSVGVDKEIRPKSKGSKLSFEEVEKSIRGLGELINAMKSKNNVLNLSTEWFNNAYEINDKRNRYIHGYIMDSSFKAGKMKPADKDTAKIFFEKTLKLISELQVKLETNPDRNS